jgi:hypothetical protein
VIGFIDTLYTVLGTTGNYGATARLHTSQFAVAHALGFSVFTRRILATDFITVSLSLQVTHEVFFAQPNCATANSEDSTQFNSKLISRNSKLDSSLPTAATSSTAPALSKSKVKVTLRLTVSQSVSLGVELHLGLMTRYLVLFDSYGLIFFCGAPSLTRGRVCLLSE